MIIVISQGAQISNRLVSLAALTGFCLRNKIQLLVLSLSDYRHDFQGVDLGRWRVANGVVVGFLPLYLFRLIARISGNRVVRFALTLFRFIHYLNHQRCWVDVEIASLKQCFWIVHDTGDWCSCMPAVSSHEAEIIKQTLHYHPRYFHQASAFNIELRKGCDLLIGVHARRGDYATHRQGCWFYTPANYLRWIDQAAIAMRQSRDQRIHFVVCSNEPGFLELTGRVDVTVSRLGSAAADQILLSMCDLIMGPPSTFSVWAAFLSNTRLLHLFSSDQVFVSSQIRRSTLFYGWQPLLEANN